MKKQKVPSLIGTRKKIQGSYSPPPDKSITHRAVFFGSLSTRRSRIKNPLLSGDCLSTIGAFRALGVPIRVGKKEVLIGPGKRSSAHGLRELKPPRSFIDCGNSGTTMRLLSGVLAAQPFRSELRGDDSLSKRPMKRVIEPLRAMGARIDARDGNFAPLVVHGRPGLNAIHWDSPVSSAQVKSCVLLAGLFAKGKTSVAEPTRSRDHTERMLDGLGARIEYRKGGPTHAKNRAAVRPGGDLDGVQITVPGDFSSAAFFIAAALLVPGSKLLVKNVNLNPTRTGLLPVLRRMGARISVERERVAGGEPIGDLRVQASVLRGAEVSKSEIPLMIDEVPILAVLATQAKGKTVISGAQELRFKESDRLAAIAAELSKMGARIREKTDGLVIEGPAPLRGAEVRSYDDHRMAMSLAVAALAAEGPTEIEAFDCIRISFPTFLRDLLSLIR